MMIAVFTLAARAMAADEFGRLAVWFNAMAFLAVFATFGQETLIARSWGEFNGAGDSASLGELMLRWRLTMISGAVVAAGLVILPPSSIKASRQSRCMRLLPAFLRKPCCIIRLIRRGHVGFVVSEVNAS